MNKITGFNKITAAAFRSDLTAVLAKYGIESNLDLKIGTIRFTNGDARMQIEAKVKGAITKEDRLVSDLVIRYNLREVSANGAKLVGYNARAHRYPIIYSLGGKKYKTSLDHAKFLFAK